MQVRNILNSVVVSVVISTILAISSTPSYAQVSKESIVRITANGQVGTGFVWQGQRQQKYIVTSLHTLAGAQGIYYNRVSQETKLVVYKVDFESDLALLRPATNPITLPALAIGNDLPKMSARYSIYGFPAGVKLVQGDSIEFSDAQHNVALIDFLPSTIVRDLTASGFPEQSLRVLRVSSGITPGHSGAPIIDLANNQVIGIGAGGLSKAGFRRVNWAVPAKSYLLALEANGKSVDVSTLSPNAESNYKHSVSDEAGDEDASLVAGDSKFYHIYQVDMQTLISSLIESQDSEDPIIDSESLAQILSDAETIGYNLQDAMIDIYQHVETGSMMFVPASASLEIEGNIVLASSADERLMMLVEVQQSESVDDAVNAKDAYADFIIASLDVDDWSIGEESDAEPYHDEASGTWENWQVLKHNVGSETESGIDLTLNIQYSDVDATFFGVAIITDEWPTFTQEHNALWHQLEVCIQLSGFRL
jgi:hypothetical protein